MLSSAVMFRLGASRSMRRLFSISSGGAGGRNGSSGGGSASGGFNARRARPQTTDRGFTLTDAAEETTGARAGTGVRRPRRGTPPPFVARDGGGGGSASGSGSTKSGRKPVATASADTGASKPRAFVDALGRVHALGGAAALGDADAEAEIGGESYAGVEVDVDDLLSRDPALRRRAYQQALYRRRAVRTALGADEEETSLYAAAVAREHANDIELTDVDEVTRPGDYVRGTGEDPLEREGLPFDVSSLRVTAHMCLTAPLGARPRDRRVRLDAVVGRLGLDRTVALYVRAIAGTRFDASKDLLTISVDKHEQAGLNRREALEQLVGLVSEAERLKGQFGAFPAVTHLPRYS